MVYHWICQSEWTNQDLERLVDLDRSVYPAEDCLSVEEYREYEKRGNLNWLMCNDKGEWVGNVQIAPQVPKPENEDSMYGNLPSGVKYVSGLTIFLPFQGKNLSYLLLQKVIESFWNYKIITRTRSDNIRAQRVLEGSGFTRTSDQIKNGSIWQWYQRILESK